LLVIPVQTQFWAIVLWCAVFIVLFVLAWWAG